MTNDEYQQWMQRVIEYAMKPGQQYRSDQQLTLNDLFGIVPTDKAMNTRKFASGEYPNAWWFANRSPDRQRAKSIDEHERQIAQDMSVYGHGRDTTKVPTAQRAKDSRRPVAIVERRTPKTLHARDHRGVRDAWNPDQYIRSFRLVDNEGKPLSVIDDGGYHQPGEGQREAVRGFSGQTTGPKRRGHYRNLMEGLVRHGLNVRSNDRNDMSHPFHTKFQRTLPRDIAVQASIRDRSGDVEHYAEGEYDPSDVRPYDALLYERNIPSSPENWGDLSGPTRSRFPITVEHRERIPFSEHPEWDGSKQTQLFIPKRPIGVSPSVWAATNPIERRNRAEQDLRSNMDWWFSRQQQGEQALRQGGVSLDETLDLGLLPGISQPPMPRMEYETNPRFVGVKSTPDVM